jgi:hypothetical protein
VKGLNGGALVKEISRKLLNREQLNFKVASTEDDDYEQSFEF